MYSENNLVKIAKRENNNKRNYLVMNSLQGKHIKTSPKMAFEMFGALADILKREYSDEKILVVGFAETATAIGARVAYGMKFDYIQTTREVIEGVEYLFFTEAHSHATEQKLVKDDIDEVIGDIDRIIFVEDEVTTGNTILDIINIIDKNYENRINYSVASILNGMDENSLKIYESRNIKVHYLVKTEHSKYSEVAERYKTDGKYIMPDINDAKDKYTEFEIDGALNPRRKVSSETYDKACEDLYSKISEKINFESDEKILVIGTEEAMYQALYVGCRLEEKGLKVFSHSTTRSPIATDIHEDYPVHTRYELKSLYDSERKTFIYDLKKYDKVLIITDAVRGNKGSDKDYGINSLVNALKFNNNENIYLVRWLCN